jgi:hypothetical protein
MSEDRITGGCQCGAVRFAISGALGRASICHCRMCQKAFGAFYAPLVGVPLAAFQLTRGELAIFRSSEEAERGFCRDCGTPLSFRYVDSDTIDVSIGSLDEPGQARPVMQFRLESRLPWVGELDALPAREDDPATTDRLGRVRQSSYQHPDHETEQWPPAGSAARGRAGP